MFVLNQNQHDKGVYSLWCTHVVRESDWHEERGPVKLVRLGQSLHLTDQALTDHDGIDARGEVYVVLEDSLLRPCLDRQEVCDQWDPRGKKGCGELENRMCSGGLRTNNCDQWENQIT